jgi:hypothetical protein
MLSEPIDRECDWYSCQSHSHRYCQLGKIIEEFLKKMGEGQERSGELEEMA